jgi:Icc-related predicted phosphoesterase
MQLVCISDVHGEFDRFAAEDLPDGDVCVVAGDLTNVGRRHEPEMAGARAWLRTLGTRYRAVLVIPGNHDIGVRAADWNLPGVHWVDGTAVALEGSDGSPVVFRGVSLTTCYDMPEMATIWDFMTCRPEVEEAAFDIPPCDVLLSHGPPYGVLDSCGVDLRTGQQRHIGSPALGRYIRRHSPRLVVCGHVHEAAGTARVGETLVVNTARRATAVRLSPARD